MLLRKLTAFSAVSALVLLTACGGDAKVTTTGLDKLGSCTFSSIPGYCFELSSNSSIIDSSMCAESDGNGGTVAGTDSASACAAQYSTSPSATYQYSTSESGVTLTHKLYTVSSLNGKKAS